MAVTGEGDVTFRIKGPGGTLAWLDGSPVQNVAEFTAPLTVGNHTLTVRALAVAGSTEDLTVEVVPAKGSAARVLPVGGQ